MTNNAKDFEPLHHEYDHAGILLYYEQGLPNTDPEGLARAVDEVLNQYRLAGIENRLVDLGEWYEWLHQECPSRRYTLYRRFEATASGLASRRFTGVEWLLVRLTRAQPDSVRLEDRRDFVAPVVVFDNDGIEVVVRIEAVLPKFLDSCVQ